MQVPDFALEWYRALLLSFSDPTFSHSCSLCPFNCPLLQVPDFDLEWYHAGLEDDNVDVSDSDVSVIYAVSDRVFVVTVCWRSNWHVEESEQSHTSEDQI